MTSIPLPAHRQRFLVQLLIALILTLFLFYIDEGYYNFNWMKEPGNWVAFGFYSGSFLAGECLVDHTFFRRRKGLSGIFLSSVAGLLVGVLLLSLLFMRALLYR